MPSHVPSHVPNHVPNDMINHVINHVTIHFFSLTSQDDQKADDNIAIKLQLDENELIFDSNSGQWYSG